MSPVTTESGQARKDLIAMFEEAQQLAEGERRKARGLRAVISRAVSNSSVHERGDGVDVHMPRDAWQALQDSATGQP